MTRQLGYGVLGSIPFSEILAALSWVKIASQSEQGSRWIRFLQAMDTAYVTHVNTEIQRSLKQGQQHHG